MPRTSTATIQTPGVMSADSEAADQAAEPQEAQAAEPQEAQAAALPPDLAALVQREVQAGIAKAMAVQAKARANPVSAGPLPTQAEAVAMIEAKPPEEQRSVLSCDGWVVPKPQPNVARDANGFAKA